MDVPFSEDDGGMGSAPAGGAEEEEEEEDRCTTTTRRKGGGGGGRGRGGRTLLLRRGGRGGSSHRSILTSSTATTSTISGRSFASSRGSRMNVSLMGSLTNKGLIHAALVEEYSQVIAYQMGLHHHHEDDVERLRSLDALDQVIPPGTTASGKQVTL